MHVADVELRPHVDVVGHEEIDSDSRVQLEMVGALYETALVAAADDCALLLAVIKLHVHAAEPRLNLGHNSLGRDRMNDGVEVVKEWPVFQPGVVGLTRFERKFAAE